MMHTDSNSPLYLTSHNITSIYLLSVPYDGSNCCLRTALRDSSYALAGTERVTPKNKCVGFPGIAEEILRLVETIHDELTMRLVTNCGVSA